MRQLLSTFAMGWLETHFTVGTFAVDLVTDRAISTGTTGHGTVSIPTVVTNYTRVRDMVCQKKAIILFSLISSTCTPIHIQIHEIVTNSWLRFKKINCILHNFILGQGSFNLGFQVLLKYISR